MSFLVRMWVVRMWFYDVNGLACMGIGYCGFCRHTRLSTAEYLSSCVLNVIVFARPA